ncbi:hypothetical protein HDV04_002561 [Boothiomyces sp. JEL0838]|nr:hypothetical protein HDV04_002561 [Boothiomyces sp. JEL0838]
MDSLINPIKLDLLSCDCEWCKTSKVETARTIDFQWPATYDEYIPPTYLDKKFKQNKDYFANAVKKYIFGSPPPDSFQKLYPMLRLVKYQPVHHSASLVDKVEEFSPELLPFDPLIQPDHLFENGGYIFPIDAIMDFDLLSADQTIIPMRMQFNAGSESQNDIFFSIRHRNTCEPLFVTYADRGATFITCISDLIRTQFQPYPVLLEPMDNKGVQTITILKPNQIKLKSDQAPPLIEESALESIGSPNEGVNDGFEECHTPNIKLYYSHNLQAEMFMGLMLNAKEKDFPINLSVKTRIKFKTLLLLEAFKGSFWENLPVELVTMIAKYDPALLYKWQLP